MNKTEQKIRTRLKELHILKQDTVEKLKIQQELALKPIDVAIGELENLLPQDNKENNNNNEES